MTEANNDDNWRAATLGHFIGLLVDTGQDPVILFRITARINCADNAFVQRLEVLQVPDGAVVGMIQAFDADVHKALAALIETEVVR